MPWQTVAVGREDFLRCPLYECRPLGAEDERYNFLVASTQLRGSYQSMVFLQGELEAPGENADVTMTTKQPVRQAWSDATKVAASTTAPDMTAWALKDANKNLILVPWHDGYHAVEQSPDGVMADCHDKDALVAKMQRYAKGAASTKLTTTFMWPPKPSWTCSSRQTCPDGTRHSFRP